ncbi:hypothetical protein [Actinokineospora sp. NBRC 105648]|uniref:hypothetical protein n=1 Tax=Actinokineospora sp. NBRC 105648 TaxID=3032206 RepID=UPI0024A55A93|nr:hypothetical protein [Actinokineospora sp. NBRC 105648]GLZ37156.1 hypothetical protein Acsp05_07810 [Actinokineospora sp. NBRC 105648]
MRDYLLEVPCAEDHKPCQKFLQDKGLSVLAVGRKEAEGMAGVRLAYDGLFLIICTDMTRVDVELFVAGHEWLVRVVGERETREFPA